MYNRCPFGIHSAAPIFQRKMETLLITVPKTVVFLDEILVTGKSQHEHLENLYEVLNRLSQAGLCRRSEKCIFMAREVEYLDLQISCFGILPSPSKIEAIANAPMPQNIAELRAFLCMLAYFGNFLPHLSTTVELPHLLLRKGIVWKWEAAQTRAFKAAKTMLSYSPLLVHYDPSKELILSCDSSSYGIGCALLQTNGTGYLQPVTYASRTLSDAERHFAQVE